MAYSRKGIWDIGILILPRYGNNEKILLDKKDIPEIVLFYCSRLFLYCLLFCSFTLTNRGTFYRRNWIRPSHHNNHGCKCRYLNTQPATLETSKHTITITYLIPCS